MNISRSKVILPKSHPFEYFQDSWSNDHNTQGAPKIYHPQPAINPDTGDKAPIYFKIRTIRSIIGLPWNKRYEAGILFKKYSPRKQYKPKFVNPRINVNTVIFREASPEVAQLVFALKEILEVKNIWTVDEYRQEAKKLLGRAAMTPDQVQEDRGYYIVGNINQ